MQDPDDQADEVRRRLLRIAIYTPPAVIGAIALSQSGCQPASCGPQQCHPNGGPCGPDSCPPPP
jgi:hypothetical protein